MLLATALGLLAVVASTPETPAAATAAVAAVAPVNDSAAPSSPNRTRLVILDLDARGVDDSVVKTIADDLAVSLQKAHIVDDVVSAGDLRALVDVDANKRAAGNCDDNGCMAEIAQALGADVVVHGSVGRLGDLYAVTVSFFDAKGTRALAREKTQALRLETLSRRVEHASQRLALQYQGKDPALAGDEPPDPAPESGANSVLLYTGLGLGAAGVVVGAVGGVLALGAVSTITDPTSSGSNKATAAALEPTYLVVAGAGAATLVAGAALAVASLVME